MFHVEQKQLRTVILDQKINYHKIFIRLSVTLISLNDFYIQHFNWFLPLKILVILYCFGSEKSYSFDNFNHYGIVYKFLSIPIYRKDLVFAKPDYVSLFRQNRFSYKLILCRVC